MTLPFSRLMPLLAGLLLLVTARAYAEPYLAVGQGYKCSACHVNPTGGGMRNDFGNIFAATLLPHYVPANSSPGWLGAITPYFRIGGDLRASWSRTDVPGQPGTEDRGLDQLRVYAVANLWPEHLSVYADESLAPGDPRTLEAYARLDVPGTGLYLKGGQFYLPFGWRLQDQTALLREVSGISMTTPDKGVELGFDRGAWSVQLDYTRGAANASSGTGHQLTTQWMWVQTRYRLGAAASFTQSQAGNRTVSGLFAGLRTGPVAWLGEADLVRDGGYPEGTRTLAAGLAEADWTLHRGHNLKITAEYFDPDRATPEDQKLRWSLLYELTPVRYLQLRAGLRRYRGIPQSNVDNRHLLFVELHGYF